MFDFSGSAFLADQAAQGRAQRAAERTQRTADLAAAIARYHAQCERQRAGKRWDEQRHDFV